MKFNHLRKKIEKGKKKPNQIIKEIANKNKTRKTQHILRTELGADLDTKVLIPTIPIPLNPSSWTSFPFLNDLFFSNILPPSKSAFQNSTYQLRHRISEGSPPLTEEETVNYFVHEKKKHEKKANKKKKKNHTKSQLNANNGNRSTCYEFFLYSEAEGVNTTLLLKHVRTRNCTFENGTEYTVPLFLKRETQAIANKETYANLEILDNSDIGQTDRPPLNYLVTDGLLEFNLFDLAGKKINYSYSVNE
jgi:hypothetical protein